MLEYEMAPNFETTFKNKKLTTNRWGMRDRNYDLVAPASTHRIAILGASAVFGSGVADDEVFETVLEGMLNNDQAYQDRIDFEVLNFSKFARVALQQVMVLESKVVRFKPDAMLLFVHRNEARRSLELLARLVKNNIDAPYPFVQSVIDRAGVDSAMSRFEIEKRLLPYADELLAGTYQAIAGICRDHGIVPVWVFMPITNERLEDADIAGHMATAEAAGFVLLSLRGVYDEYEPDELTVAAWDDHPNKFAHELIADRLYMMITKELFKETDR